MEPATSFVGIFAGMNETISMFNFMARRLRSFRGGSKGWSKGKTEGHFDYYAPVLFKAVSQ